MVEKKKINIDWHEVVCRIIASLDGNTKLRSLTVDCFLLNENSTSATFDDDVYKLLCNATSIERFATPTTPL
jgi:hypothetical protein